MRSVVVSIMIFAFLCVSASCARKEGEKGPYLAKVGSQTITLSDLERELRALPEFAQKLFEGPEGKEKFLDEMIKKELLYQEALKKGLQKDPEYLQKLEEFKKLTLIGRLLEKEIELKAKVTEEDVKDYYDKHKDELSAVSQIRASHILVKTEAEARNILERLKTGEDFAAIARKSSMDPGSAQNGGDLGYFSPGQMVPEFEAAAEKLKTGEVSTVPVRTKFGYHIIKVTDKKKGKPVEFEKIKSMLFQRISADRQKEFFDSYIEDLKKTYTVQINQEAVSKLSAEEEKKQESQSAPAKESKKEAPEKK